MNVGQRFTQDDYTGYVFPASGFMDVGGGVPGRRSALTLGRVMYKGNNPDEADMARRMQAMGCTWQEYLNEVNLKMEGDWTRQTYRDSFLRARAAYHGLLGYSSMSPNGDYLSWYADALGSGTDFVSIHIYGQTFDALVDMTQSILQATAPLPAIISELNFGYGPGIVIDKNAWARSVLRSYLMDYVRTQPRILATLYFADTWNADTPGATSVDSRGTAIVDVLAEAANLPTDYNIGTGFKKVRDQLGWVPLENEIYHFEGNPTLKASMAVFDLGHATWDPRSNATVAIDNYGSIWTDGGNQPLDYGRLVQIR